MNPDNIDDILDAEIAENSQASESYEVGYCKPPVGSRFETGKSGNPKGRPKGSISIKQAFERTLKERVVINENGQRKTITKLEAAMKQLTNRAASGDLGAMKQFIVLVCSTEEQSASSTQGATLINETDEKVLESIMKRLNDAPQGGSHGDD